MFEKRKLAKQSEMLYFLVSSEGKKNAIIDSLVTTILMLPKYMFSKGYPLGDALIRMKCPVIFDNKFVSTESAILSYILLEEKLLSIFTDFDSYIASLSLYYQKIWIAIQFLYGFSSDTIDDLYDKRNTFFKDALYDSDTETGSFVNKAIELLSHAYYENNFIPFSHSTPLLLLDALDQLNISLQVREYFRKVFEIIDTNFPKADTPSE